MKIERLKDCTGCHACYSACPRSAISMNENIEGFLYPFVDRGSCISCGRCESVCPILTPLKLDYEFPLALAAYTSNEQIRLESSSGGIFSVIANKILYRGGVVFGAKFTKDFSVVHSWIEKQEDLADFRGSKYVQSTIGDSYKKCKDFLEDGRLVLFTGTPCQIHGLKKFLGKEYANLLTQDIICHGVPSNILWQKYIQFREKRANSSVAKIAFRRKDDGWKLFSLAFSFENASEYRPLDNYKDPYMNLFYKNISLRESCYKCGCKTIERFSDITLADFWGVWEEFPEINDDRGISFVIAHSQKGKKLINDCECFKKEIPIELGIKHNEMMNTSASRPKERNCFYKDLCDYDFEKIIKKYVNKKNIIARIKSVIVAAKRKLLGK